MSGPIRVLYVDDDLFDRKLARDALERESNGFQLVEATSRREFETLLAECDYDLVLSDINILGFDGLQVLDAVQARNPRAPVVIITGAGSEEIAIEAMRRGAADYVIKTPEHIRRLPYTILAAIERKRLQVAREETEEALRESEARFKAIFSESLDVIMIIGSENGQILNVNVAVNRLLGHEEAALVGEHFSVIFPPSLLGITRQEWIEKTRASGDTLESQEFLRVDGTVCPMDMTVTLIPWGIESAILVTLRDVTERKLAEEEIIRLNSDLERRVVERTEELAKANERLNELDELKSKFITDVSHELRTPVANLSLYLSLMERGRPEVYGRYLDVLKKQTRRLEQLIEDVLNISNLTREMKDAQFAPVDLNEVVEQVIEGYRPLAEEAGLSLTFRPDSGLPAALGERNQLTQVVANLVVNAIHYTLEGQVAVSTRLAAETGEVCLSVVDSGIGIEPNDLRYLFERFYRGRHIRELEVPGAGLGLGLVKEIVDLHGGRIEVESQVGEGAVFRVWLPAVISNR